MTGGRLRVELLGPVRAWHGSEELALGPAKQRAVFATLALHAGSPVGQHDLLSALWGPAAPASAAGSVHTYVSGLRRLLEPGRPSRAPSSVVPSTRDGYVLQVEPDAVDALAFERLLNQPATPPAAVVAKIDRAIGLWRGVPLTGLTGPFAEQERARLTELRLRAAAVRAEALLDLARYHELAAELASLTREHPLRERLHELRMLALHRGGRNAEALEVFRAARAILVAELGAEPGPALQDLRARILAGDTYSAQPVARQVPPSWKSGISPHFHVPVNTEQRLTAGAHPPPVGRDGQLRQIRALVDDVRTGRGHALWLEGDAGSGKTELLHTALSGLSGQGCHLAWTVADSFTAALPCQALSWCLGVEGVGGTQEIATAVDTLCAAAPLVLVLEDAHRADRQTLLAWEGMVMTVHRRPLLLITTVRPAMTAGNLSRLRQTIAGRGGSVLRLAPLTTRESTELLRLLLGAVPGPALCEVAEQLAGSPRDLDELVRGLLSEDTLRRDAGEVDLAAPAGYAPPRSLLDALRREILALTGQTRSVVRWAALLGPEFTVPDLAAVTGCRPSTLVASCRELLAARLVNDMGTRFGFRNALVHQAAYETTPMAARAALHRQAAEVLARAGAPLPRIGAQLAAAATADRLAVDGSDRRTPAG